MKVKRDIVQVFRIYISYEPPDDMNGADTEQLRCRLLTLAEDRSPTEWKGPEVSAGGFAHYPYVTAEYSTLRKAEAAYDRLVRYLKRRKCRVDP